MMDQPNVRIKQGVLNGTVERDYKGRGYYSFLGIPYAKPPLGDLRFKSPQPPEPWDGIWDATQPRSDCFARGVLRVYRETVGSEDCLYINIYTPKLPKNEDTKSNLLPVLFYVHGGGFTIGSGHPDSYGPEYLVAEDVIVVTFNYRLGALGFISFDDLSLGIPGNAGLKDQIAALRWVNENIHAFGGCSSQITICGESAGACSVHLLMLSPRARGLYRAVIAQSGVANNAWVITPRIRTQQVLNNLGCMTTDPKEMYRFLMTKTSIEILKAQEKIERDGLLDFGEIISIGPTIEPRMSPDAIITEHPTELLKRGAFTNVPFLVGCNQHEGILALLLPGRSTLSPDVTEYSGFCPFYLHPTPMSRPALGDRIKRFYYGNKTPSSQKLRPYIDYHSDILFLHQTYVAARNHAKHGSSPVYYYEFCLDTNLNLTKDLVQDDWAGICHADELTYIFTNIVKPADVEVKPDSPEDRGRHIMLKLWTNFVKNCDPNPKGKEKWIDVKWEPVGKDNFKYLEIGDKLKMVYNAPAVERMKFWDELVEQNNRLLNKM